MRYKAYFEIPENPHKKDIQGSSPILLNELFNELEDSKEIHLSFFLYNNPFLHERMEFLSLNGCKIFIYSIPLNGYTKQLVKIYNPRKNREFTSSKHEYAKKIYNRIENNTHPNISLKLFPHTYVWTKQLFSRGKEAYSLHNKSILVRMKDGTNKCISSSSNLAFADPPHSENFLVVENDPSTVRMFEQYFRLLDDHSLTLEAYKHFSEKYYDFEYSVKPVDLDQNQFDNCFYTAPFISYNGQGSNHFIQEKIISFIKTAKKRIFSCSQHYMDIDSYDKKAKSIVETLKEVANTLPSLEIKILKQTRAENQAQGIRTLKAEQYVKQLINAEQRFLSPTIHDKFIIVDERILIMTANITPTQYAWGYPHIMKYEFENQIYEIDNCFSEINSFHFIEDPDLTKKYLDHYIALWRMSTAI